MKRICSLIVLNAILWMNLGFLGVQNTFAAENSAPVITSPDFVEVEENTTSVMTVTATDAEDSSEDLFYEVSGGADFFEFWIDGTTHELSFFDAPDYEAPNQAGGVDNEYEVEITVTDNSDPYMQDVQLITVTVSDIDENIETPVITSHSDGDVIGNAILTLEGTGTPGATIIVDATDGSSVWFGPVVDSEGEFSFELTLEEGNNNLYVYSQNNDGYESDGEFITLIVDTGSDLIENLNVISHENGEIIETLVPILEGTGPIGNTIEVLDQLTGMLLGEGEVDLEGEFSLELSLDEGTNNFEILSLDEDDFITGEIPFSLLVEPASESESNELLVLSHEDGDFINTTAPVLEGIGVPNSTFELTNLTTGVDNESDNIDDEGNFSVQLTLVEGLNELYMYTLDENYQNNGEFFIDIFVDTEAPIVTFTDDAESEAVYSDTVIIDFDDNNTDPDYDIFHFYTFVDTETCNEDTYQNSGELYSSYIKGDEILFDTEGFNGKYVCIEVEDIAGNISYGVSANPINIDVSLPSPYDVVIISPSDNEIVGTATPTIIGTAGIDSLVEIESEDETFFDLIEVDGEGEFSYTFSSDLEEGEHMFYLVPSIQGEVASINFIVDTTPAVISVIGESSIVIEHGEDYTDQGAEYSDAVDGEGAIIGEGSVDSSTVGEYEITYNYTDESGNISEEVVRTVSVVDTTSPTITVVGENTVETEYGEVYVDAGAEYSDNVDGTGSVDGIGEVDVNTLGGYTLTYDYTDESGNIASTASRLVNVVDTTSAVITLTGESSIEVEYSESYSDEGAEYSDSVDGTGSIVGEGSADTSTLGEYVITYNYTDAAGNVSDEVVRIITVVDTTSPVITLAGDSSVSVTFGSTYTDSGASYKDNVDRSNSVVGVGTVDTSVAGDYTITYNYTDTSGNAAEEVSRVVTVNAEAVASSSGGGGGGGGSSTPTCITEKHLECRQNVSGVYVYYKQSGKTCRGGSLGKSCTVTATQETSIDSVGNKKTELEKQEIVLVGTTNGSKYKDLIHQIDDKLSNKNKEVVIGRIDKIDLDNPKYAKYRETLIYLRLLLEYSLLD